MKPVDIDRAQVSKFADSLRRFRFAFDDFTDPLLYPGPDEDRDAVANFFFFMVAIDHRTHPRGQIFKGRVRGIELQGAELLWALAKRKFERDPRFFTTVRLSTITTKEVADAFHSYVVIAGPAVRARLIRDCARKLERHFGGSVLNFVRNSDGFLIRDDNKGFLQQLRRFGAYRDPVNKKSFLLAKFLDRRGILQIKDLENLHVPVDNIVQRLALRTGMLRLNDKKLETKIRKSLRVTHQEELTIRETASVACDKVSRILKLSAPFLDDILWEFGRVHCRNPIPNCDSLPEPARRRPYRMIAGGPIGECVFAPGCRSYRDPDGWELKEPNFPTVNY